MPLTRPSSPKCCNSSATGSAATRPARRFLEEFIGNPAYGTTQLREDLDRFTFLPGGDDGESLFGPVPP
ncbi:MAG: hypothetical protein ACR2FU_00350 [Streptosporangiaceae bacterium]